MEIKKPVKHRARRPKATANPAASLFAALKFVAVAQKKTGTVQQQFGMISGNWAAASNGVLTVATKLNQIMKHKYKQAIMQTAFAWAETSEAKRLKVGAVIAREDNILSIGLNGTYKGLPNHCEDEDGNTLPHVRHAEAAALDKLVRSTESAVGATMYVTHSPCLLCAYRIFDAGIKAVVFSEFYRDKDGIDWLKDRGVVVEKLGV